jgi:hypothetical protein
LGVLLIVVGGFAVVYRILKPPASQKQVSTVSRMICDDSYRTTADYESDNPPYIDFELHPGCFSGWVKLPRNWHSWQGQFLGNQPTAWVAEWYDGWPNPTGPLNNEQLTTTLSNVNVPSKILRLQGSGVIRFYRTRSVTAKADTPPVSLERAEVKPTTHSEEKSTEPARKDALVEKNPAQPPKPIHPPIHMQPLEGTQHNILMTMELCERTNRQTIHCWGYASNLTDESAELNLNDGQAVDEEGNASKFTVALPDQFFFSDRNRQFNVPAGSRVKYFVNVSDKDKTVRAITLHMNTSLSTPGRGYDLEWTFKNVPVAIDE